MSQDALTQAQLEELRAALVRLRDECEASLTGNQDDSKPVDLDLSIGRLSRVDAMQQQQMAVARRGRLEAQAQQVRAALARLDADSYGECVSCGEPIGFRRLQVKPETALCLGCQR